MFHVRSVNQTLVWDKSTKRAILIFYETYDNERIGLGSPRLGAWHMRAWGAPYVTWLYYPQIFAYSSLDCSARPKFLKNERSSLVGVQAESRIEWIRLE